MSKFVDNRNQQQQQRPSRQLLSHPHNSSPVTASPSSYPSATRVGNGSSNTLTINNRDRTIEHITASTMSQAFYSYGKFCVCHPWEVIVAFFTLSICAISIGSRRASLDHRIPGCNNIPCPSKVCPLSIFLS